LSVENAILAIAGALVVAMLLALWRGWQTLRSARHLTYFLLRRERLLEGWRWIAGGASLGILAGLALVFGRQAVDLVYQPPPTLTPTPSQTLPPSETPIPSITLTPTISQTPTISATPTDTGTPQLPTSVAILLQESVTPNPEALFSPIAVARRLDNQNNAINPDDEFENPIRRLFGAFTYDGLQDGVRWTAIWYRGDEVICLETIPWDGGTGGHGFTECETEQWLPGEYEIQIFYAETWMVSTRFEVYGDPPTPTPTFTPTPSPTPTSTPTLLLQPT
jgi:type VI secretion system secreted protein VgrG